LLLLVVVTEPVLIVLMVMIVSVAIGCQVLMSGIWGT
jgi:hypothetical protein